MTTAQSTQAIGEIIFNVEKTIVVMYERRKNPETGKVEKVPITKTIRVVAKRVPLLVIHVADTAKKDQHAKHGREARVGDPIKRVISEKDYKNWLMNMAVDVYGIRDIANLDMSLVIAPQYYDVVANGEVLQEGVRTLFNQAV